MSATVGRKRKREHKGVDLGIVVQRDSITERDDGANEKALGRHKAPASRSHENKRSSTNSHRTITNDAEAKTKPISAPPHTTVNGHHTALPIAAHREEIVRAVSQHRVLILTGETGSGKSTQVPQYLLAHNAESTGRRLKIAVTQPRRVAATSLAKRVATELRSPLGKAPKARVGYSVRFDANVGRDNEIVYLTEGMLLMELLRDPGLTQYSAVVVDEVHERGVDVDLLLGFLKSLVLGEGEGSKRRKEKRAGPMKVIIMSATVEVEALKGFFGDEAAHAKPGEPDDQRENSSETTSTREANPRAPSVSLVKVEGRQFPVQIIYLPEPTQDFTEAALKAIFQVHCKESMPGDVLVFMTGQETIQGLQRSVEEYAQSLGPEFPRLLVLPIYAALPQAAQQRVFEPAPYNTRKVILATNIAETSITVPGVRFVIDSGREKRKQFRPRLGLESLLVKTVSQSSAIQRKGRAGREAPGKCWRLYTEADYTAMEQTKTPEILRCDLSDAVLKMKATGISDVLTFPLLTPPSREAMARSLLHLHQLSALTDDGQISPIGRSMTRFPLSPAYARVLLAAADPENDVLLPVIDIISCFSADTTVFLNPDTEAARTQAAETRAPLLRRQGDHLTLLAVAQAYAAEHADRRAWCTARHVSHRAMVAVMDIRKQLRAQCQAQKLLAPEAVRAYDEAGAVGPDERLAENVMKCFLKGFRGNTARLMPDGSYRTFVGNQIVAVHPSSVLFGRRVEAILYAEFVFTNRSYARGVGVVQAGWVGEVFEGS